MIKQFDWMWVCSFLKSIEYRFAVDVCIVKDIDEKLRLNYKKISNRNIKKTDM